MKILAIGNRIVVKSPELKVKEEDLVLPDDVSSGGALEVVSVSEDFDYSYALEEGDLVYVRDRTRIGQTDYYSVAVDDLLGVKEREEEEE